MPFIKNVGEIREIEASAGICSFEWRVQEFLSLSVGGFDYRSPLFRACDENWCFYVDPKGMDIKLSRHGGCLHHTLQVTFGVKRVDGVRNREKLTKKFSGDDNEYYCGRFCSPSQLQGEAASWLPGGTLTIAVEVRTLDGRARDCTISSAERVVETAGLSEHQSSEKQDAAVQSDEVAADECHCAEKRAVEELQTSLQSLLKEEKDCDVVLEVGGKEFRAHRLILGARSPVFGAMFDHDTLERRRGAVTVEDCSPETFPDLLRHVYTGSVRMVSAENVFGLYSAGDKYDLAALREECSRFLRENVAVDTFCDTVALAVRHGEGDLLRRATEFFCRNSLDIVRTVEWQKFLHENTTVGNELLIKLLSKQESAFCDPE